MFSVSNEEGNLTIHSSPSTSVSTLGRAPPDEPPRASSSSKSSDSFVARRRAHSSAFTSKSNSPNEAAIAVSGSYSNAPMPLAPTNDKRARKPTSRGFSPCLASALSTKSFPHPSGKLSSKMPKTPSNGRHRAIKTRFSKGRLNGLMLNPLASHPSAYSNAIRPSGVDAMVPTVSPWKETRTLSISGTCTSYLFRLLSAITSSMEAYCFCANKPVKSSSQ